MAVRASQRAKQAKRFDYVSDESTWDGFSSSGDEGNGSTGHNKKVRNPQSVRSLYLESCSYYKSDEHGYTQCKRRRRDTENSENTAGRKKRCENRNAVNARLNRERKKAYLMGLEEELEQLREVKKTNEDKLKEQEQKIVKLKEELIQMKSLLANNKYLNNLVSKLSQVTGLPVTSSFIPKICQENPARTRSVPLGVNHPVCNNDVSLGGRDMFFPLISQLPDAQPEPTSILEDDYFVDYDMKELFPLDFDADLHELDKNVGICVHINQSRLSVEFCSVCNARATTV